MKADKATAQVTPHLVQPPKLFPALVSVRFVGICHVLLCTTADLHNHSRQNLLPIKHCMQNPNIQYSVSDPVVQTNSVAAHAPTETHGGCHCAGHLSLTICDTSTLAERRRELHMLAQMATYTMSLLNGSHTRCMHATGLSSQCVHLVARRCILQRDVTHAVDVTQQQQHTV